MMNKLTVKYETVQGSYGSVTVAVGTVDGVEVILGKHYNNSKVSWNILDIVRVRLSLDEWKEKLIKDLKEGEDE
jgi:hypothetical protein